MSDPICSSCGAATDAVHLVCEGCEQEWALRAEAAEARERAKDEALRQAKARLERGWPDAAMREFQAALAQQPADQGAQGERLRKRHDPIPALPGEKGRRYLCEDSDGQFYYLSHADTWQPCPGPFPQRAYARGQADMRERAAQVADAFAVEWRTSQSAYGQGKTDGGESVASRIRNLRDGGDT